MIRWIGFACLVLTWIACDLTRAEDEMVPLAEIVDLHVGFDGRYKVGVWVPIEVVLRGGMREAAGWVSITVPDGDGVPSRFRAPCHVPPGAESRIPFYARFGRVHSSATVRFAAAEGEVVERVFHSSPEPGVGEYPSALVADRKLVVCLVASSAAVEEAAALVTYEPSRRPAVARLESLAQMPTRWYGYEGVDAVVIATSQPEVYPARMDKDGRRRAALDRWIRLGGRLLLMAGQRAEQVTDPSCPLAAFVPGRWKATVPLRQISSLESYTGGSRFDSPGGQRVPAARLDREPPEDEVEVRELDLPLVIHNERGFGQLTFLAVDLDARPLNQWKDRGALVARLLDWSKTPEETTGTAAAHLGFIDISSQLRGALDRFTGVWWVPFGVVVAVILLYILLVGPGDYWLLRRLGRFSWTWITFPLLILVFSAGAYWAVYRLKGTQLRLNQVDLVDVDTSTALVRGTHWSNLYSPRADSYDLSLRPRFFGKSVTVEDPVLLAWLGLPGSGLGGMDPKTINPTPWREAYRFAPSLDRIEGLPMQAWSTRSFTGRWSGTWTDCPRGGLICRDDVLDGRLTKPLDVTLWQCLLIHDRWVYKLDEVGPRASIRVDDLGDRIELKTLLTGRQMVRDEGGEKIQFHTPPYNTTSVDPYSILRTMMFFDHAGGRGYTHLSNQYQPFVDLSHLLGMNCALLVGVAEAPAADLCCDGQPLDGPGNRRLSVYRFVFPVESEGSRQ